MNRRILSYEEIKDIPLGSSDELLVPANSYDASVVCQYKKFDMFPWTGFDVLVRDSVARKLAEVQAVLQRKYGLGLKVVYGYRSVEVQSRYYEKRFSQLKLEYPSLADSELRRLTHNYVAVPDSAGHTLGAAVDVTLVDGDGQECDMGTEVADFSDALAIQTFSATGQAMKRRTTLLETMMAAGFAPFLGEWWHFSYGDKEWAAYYGQTAAVYGPVSIDLKTKVYTIAGGNRTALQMAEGWIDADTNRRVGEAMMATCADIDQAGIYYRDSNRLEMMGGEFCGNATAATAAMLGPAANTSYSFGTSGFDGPVGAQVEPLLMGRARVELVFKGIKYDLSQKELLGRSMSCVDFGGIVHVLIEGALPVDYKTEAINIRTAAQLSQREAVGVIWFNRVDDDCIAIDPVVWVRDIDTLFYESSCGSGSMAAAVAVAVQNIQQPTGSIIKVMMASDSITTVSEIQAV